MSKKGKLNVEEAETKNEKQLAKEQKKAERYANSMVSRREAFNIASTLAEEKTKEAFAVISNPLSTAIIELMAISQLLVEKGILTESEITERIQKIAVSQVEAVETGDATNGEEEKD